MIKGLKKWLQKFCSSNNFLFQKMISKTRGIIFKTIKYSDNSLIVKVYTELFGLRSYITRGLNKKKISINKSNLQPLSIVNILVYENGKGGLQTIKEIESAYPYRSLPFDVRKSCIALFINEVMYHSIRNEIADIELFKFLYNTLINIDEIKDKYENLHLQFLINLAKYLGIAPRNNYSATNQFFDLQEGIFISEPPMHANWLNETLSQKLFQIIKQPETTPLLFTNAAARNEILFNLMNYFRFHIPGFGELKSPAILSEVLT